MLALLIQLYTYGDLLYLGILIIPPRKISTRIAVTVVRRLECVSLLLRQFSSREASFTEPLLPWHISLRCQGSISTKMRQHRHVLLGVS